MKDEQFLRINEELTKILLAIKAGNKDDILLETLNNDIDYLNIQIDYTPQLNTLKKTNEYYALIDLCLLYYRTRDRFLLV